MDRVHQSEPLEWVTLQAIAESLQRVYNPFQGFWLVNVTAFIWFAIRFHVAKIPQSPVSILGHPVLGKIILKDRCRSAVMENTRHTRLLSCTKPINCSTSLTTVASRHVGGGLVSRPTPQTLRTLYGALSHALLQQGLSLSSLSSLIEYRPMESQESKSAPKDSLSANTRRRKVRYEASANLVASTDVRSSSGNSTSSSFSSTSPPLPSPPHPVPSSSALSPPSVSSRLTMSTEKRGLIYMFSLEHSYLLLL